MCFVRCPDPAAPVRMCVIGGLVRILGPHRLSRDVPCVLGQCLDDSLTNVVPKDQLTSYKLGGAPECHAPELAQELRDAKAEVGAASIVTKHACFKRTRHFASPLPCAVASVVYRFVVWVLCRGSTLHACPT